MQLLVILLLAGTVLAWRPGGPLLAMLIAWLVCTVPVAAGMIVYDYLGYADYRYLVLIGLSVAAFYLGALAAIARSPAAASPRGTASYDWSQDFADWVSVARIARVLAYAAIVFLVADALTSGRNLTDLGALRSQVIEATQAGWLGRLASVLTWACFFCFAFALYFRQRLTRSQLASYFAASIGIVLTALTSAGRQAVFQVILLTLVLEMLRGRRLRSGGTTRRGAARGVVIVLGCLYLVFVTMTRTSGIAGYSKSDLFLYFFNAHLDPRFEAALFAVNENLRDVVVEFLIYSTHTVALFSRFIDIDFGGHYWGMLDFPFLFRQLEPVIGYRVVDALDAKAFYLKADSVIGVGWTTTFSSMMMDFGVAGGLALLAVQGYLGQRANALVAAGAGFGMVLLLTLAIMAAIYLPYLPLFSDTNMFFLLVVVGGILARRRLAVGRTGSYR